MRPAPSRRTPSRRCGGENTRKSLRCDLGEVPTGHGQMLLKRADEPLRRRAWGNPGDAGQGGVVLEGFPGGLADAVGRRAVTAVQVRTQ